MSCLKKVNTCYVMSQKPYVDQSRGEISIHCLEKQDAQLLYDAVINEFNNIPRGDEFRDERKRLVHLKLILENAQLR